MRISPRTLVEKIIEEKCNIPAVSEKGNLNVQEERKNIYFHTFKESS
jgi:hypothetical protein